MSISSYGYGIVNFMEKSLYPLYLLDYSDFCRYDKLFRVKSIPHTIYCSAITF